MCSVVFARWACDKQTFVLGHSLDAWSCELISEVLNKFFAVDLCVLFGWTCADSLFTPVEENLDKMGKKKSVQVCGLVLERRKKQQ